MQSAAWEGDWVLTQPFGCTDVQAEPVDPGCPDGHTHQGIDMGMPSGTRLFAVAAGYVESSGLGWLWLRTSPTERWGYFHGYQYLSGGVNVAAGQQVGLSDNVSNPDAGIVSQGAHLHLQYEVNGVPTNPIPYLEGADMTTVQEAQLAQAAADAAAAHSISQQTYNLLNQVSANLNQVATAVVQLQTECAQLKQDINQLADAEHGH